MSLRDELAHVLGRHFPQFVTERACACGASPENWRDDWTGTEEEYAETEAWFAAHQADAVIAHLALTEEWGVSQEWLGRETLPAPNEEAARRAARIRYDEPGTRPVRRYVTPWENT